MKLQKINIYFSRFVVRVAGSVSPCHSKGIPRVDSPCQASCLPYSVSKNSNGSPWTGIGSSITSTAAAAHPCSSSSFAFYRTPPLFMHAEFAGSNTKKKTLEFTSHLTLNTQSAGWRKKKVAFLTDVEGNMSYFQKWVAQSHIICWEEKQITSTATRNSNSNNNPSGEWANGKHPFHSSPNVAPSASSSSLPLPHPSIDIPPRVTYLDLDRLILGFRDDDGTQEFVYGGDAFDQGWDLSFSRALLDFKERFPQRVHLILGNRDLNKIVVKRLFPPIVPIHSSTPNSGDTNWSRASAAPAPPSPGGGGGEESLSGLSSGFMVGSAGGSSLHQFPNHFSSLGKYSLLFRRQSGVMGHLCPKAAEEAIFPARSGAPAKVSYADYLQMENEGRKLSSTLSRGSKAEFNLPIEADPVSFLKWALTHRLGSSMTFENRREELHVLCIQEQEQQRKKKEEIGEKEKGETLPPPPLPTDEEVAASFAIAAAPGGVYDRYLQHGQLLHVIGSALFLHGGLAEENLGLVPSIHAPYNFPLDGCQRMLEVEHSSSFSSISPSSSVTTTTSNSHSNNDNKNVANSYTLFDWFNALHEFHQSAFEEYHTWTGSQGEALRRYGNHRHFAPYSVAVNSPLRNPYGPSFFPLSVMHHLLMSGIQYMCVGHMPCGDTPLIMRQPPIGALTCIAADNSYCGRGNACSSPKNPRGEAVTEVILHLVVQDESKQQEEQSSPHGKDMTTKWSTGPPVEVEDAVSRAGMCLGSTEETVQTKIEKKNGGTVEAEKEHIHLHGRRADGAPFAFDIDSTEPFLGRCLRRRPPPRQHPPPQSLYPCPGASSSQQGLTRGEVKGEKTREKDCYQEEWTTAPVAGAESVSHEAMRSIEEEVVVDEYWWVKRKGIYPTVPDAKGEKQEGGKPFHANHRRMNNSSATQATHGLAPGEEYYALHCTKDHFYSEEELLIPSSVLARIFFPSSPSCSSPDVGETSMSVETGKEGTEKIHWGDFFLPEGSSTSFSCAVVGGELRNEYTPESLRDIRVSRLKTKVIPSSPHSSLS